MISKRIFGLALQRELADSRTLKEISDWSLKILLHYRYQLEKDLDRIVLTLTVMNNSHEFKLTLSELHQLANDLIEGKEPKIKLESFDTNGN